MAYYRDGEFDSFNPDETVGFSHSFAGLSANLEKMNGWAFRENNEASMDLHLSRMREYPSEDMRILPPISPYAGIHIRDVDDFFPRGFTCEELDRVYHKLLGYDEPKMYGLVAEAAEPFEDMDDYYNPGTETVSDAAIFEAIVVDHFSKTEHRMQAVKRAFKKYMGDSEIQVLDPIVGKPKTTGGFAYVTVQFPFTDGQVITIVFHSPEGDKKKIGPQDQIIAYQWLLNKRDITEVVAPENGKEISLENICKKTSQLLIKNSKRFEKQQKQAIEEKKQLTELTAQVKEAEAHQAELMDQVAAQQQTKSDLELELSQTLALVEKQKAINAELQATLDGLRKGAKKAEKAGEQAQTGTEQVQTENNGVGQTKQTLREQRDVFTKREEEDFLYTRNSVGPSEMFYMGYDNYRHQRTQHWYGAKAGTIYQYAWELGRQWRIAGNARPISIEVTNDPYNKTADLSLSANSQKITCRWRSKKDGWVWDQEKVDKNSKNLPKQDPFAVPYPQATGTPDMAIALLQREQQGYVPAAMTKEGIGDIDFVWGDDTMGLQHIIKRRNEQGIDGEAFVKMIPDIIRNGTVQSDPTNNQTKFIVSDDNKLVIALTYNNNKRTWLVTGYKKYPVDDAASVSDATPTHSDNPDLSNRMGATGNERVSNSPAEVNPSGEKNSKLTPEPAYMAEIQDIIDGKQDAMGSTAMGKRLDAIYDLSEKDGTLDTVELLLSKAADRVTMLSKKEHEHA